MLTGEIALEDVEMRENFLRICISLLIVALMISACGQSLNATSENEKISAADYPSPDWQQIPSILPDSFKGYELYSWQAGEDWVFTLIAGTNRSKSFTEITSTENSLEDGFIKISVTNQEDLKRLLGRLPQGTEIFWSGIDLTGQVEEGTLYFSYPPQETLNEIVKWAGELGIQLHTLQNP